MYLIFLAKADGTEVQVDDQEGQLIAVFELGICEGMIDILGGVDAPAKLCTLGGCATESSLGYGVCAVRAVVGYDRLLDGIALFELLMHGMLCLVADSGDLANLEVALLADGLRELCQISNETRTESLLQHAKALGIGLGVEQRAVDVINLGGDDCADGHFCIVIL